VPNQPEPELPPDITLAQEDLDVRVDPPTPQEILNAIKALQNNKAPGQDAIPAEFLKVYPELASDVLQPLFIDILEKEELPREWTQGNIVQIPKRGNLADCNNLRGVTLLSIPSKVFCKVVMMCITEAVDGILRKEQAGFRPGRGTTEHIFTLGNILEQCNECQRDFYVNFLDFENTERACGKHSGSTEYLRRSSTSSRFFYNNFTCCVQNSSSSLAVNSGVRQGCVMSSFLFILIIDWIMKNGTEQQKTGIRWTLLTKLEDLDFADDIVLISHTRSHLQQKSVRINKLAEAVGLKINIGKTKVMSNETTKEPVFINNQPLDYTDQFTYLGSVVSISGGTEEDVTARLGKARSAFARLKPVWKSNAYSRATKPRIYKSNVLPVHMEPNAGE